MAVQSPPFALQNSSAHSAALFRQAAFSPWLGGGIVSPGEYAVTAQGTPNMSVVVAGGRAWIAGTQVASVSGQSFSTQAGYFGLNDAPATVTIAAANATNPRIDLVYVAVQDAFYSGATNVTVIGVVTGTPAGSPVAPSAPSNALVLATVAVAANATSITNGNIAQTPTAALLAVARGGIDPVLSADVVAGSYLGQPRFHPTFGLEFWNNTRWVLAADATLGDNMLTTSPTLAAAAAWTDLAVVTATSNGGTCVARWSGAVFNGASGADRTASFQVVCDSTVLGGLANFSVPVGTGQNNPRIPRFGAYSSAPAAGAHTWKLQANASLASAVIAEAGALTVVELRG